MKHLTLTVIIFILFFTHSCTTLNISQIQDMNKEPFQSLKLEPATEVNNLRIDLIRQSYTEHINDSTKKEKKKPYHVLGFDLGNGLFYDMNENLSLRIDYLLGIPDKTDFEINKTNPRWNRRQTTYSFIHDTLTVSYSNKKRSFYQYHQINKQDSTAYFYKKRFKYAIVNNDSTTVLRGKKANWRTIYMISKNEYSLSKSHKRWNYSLKNNTINLENDYLVNMSDNGNTIQIMSQGKRRNRILYTLEKDANTLFIYNKRYCGIKLDLSENSFTLTNEKIPLVKYKSILRGTSN